MALRVFSAALLATNLAMATPRPVVDSPGVSLVERQTCSTCILGGNPFVKLLKALVQGSDQTTDDCRLEQIIDMPDDAGGLLEGVTNIDGMVRVSYEEDQNMCSIEVLTFDATGDNIRCIEGGCGVSDITDTEATVTWGGCWLVNQNYYDPNVALKDTDCIPMKGTIRFKRHHGDTTKCGAVLTQEVTLHDKSVGLDTILNGREFTGGTVQKCSTLH